jgi:ribosomal protein L7Ae-like RNA K-turn-binding protein
VAGEIPVPGMIGLAKRAGAVVTGVPAVRQAIRDGRAQIVLTAKDASAGQLAKVEGILAHRPVVQKTVGSMSALGEVVGKPPIAALAITDRGFAKAILRKLEGL